MSFFDFDDNTEQFRGLDPDIANQSLSGGFFSFDDADLGVFTTKDFDEALNHAAYFGGNDVQEAIRTELGPDENAASLDQRDALTASEEATSSTEVDEVYSRAMGPTLVSEPSMQCAAPPPPPPPQGEGLLASLSKVGSRGVDRVRPVREHSTRKDTSEISDTASTITKGLLPEPSSHGYSPTSVTSTNRSPSTELADSLDTSKAAPHGADAWAKAHSTFCTPILKVKRKRSSPSNAVTENESPPSKSSTQGNNETTMAPPALATHSAATHSESEGQITSLGPEPPQSVVVTNRSATAVSSTDQQAVAGVPLFLQRQRFSAPPVSPSSRPRGEVGITQQASSCTQQISRTTSAAHMTSTGPSSMKSTSTTEQHHDETAADRSMQRDARVTGTNANNRNTPAEETAEQEAVTEELAGTGTTVALPAPAEEEEEEAEAVKANQEPTKTQQQHRTKHTRFADTPPQVFVYTPPDYDDEQQHIRTRETDNGNPLTTGTTMRRQATISRRVEAAATTAQRPPQFHQQQQSVLSSQMQMQQYSSPSSSSSSSSSSTNDRLDWTSSSRSRTSPSVSASGSIASATAAPSVYSNTRGAVADGSPRPAAQQPQRQGEGQGQYREQRSTTATAAARSPEEQIDDAISTVTKRLILLKEESVDEEGNGDDDRNNTDYNTDNNQQKQSHRDSGRIRPLAVLTNILDERAYALIQSVLKLLSDDAYLQVAPEIVQNGKDIELLKKHIKEQLQCK